MRIYKRNYLLLEQRCKERSCDVQISFWAERWPQQLHLAGTGKQAIIITSFRAIFSQFFEEIRKVHLPGRLQSCP